MNDSQVRDWMMGNDAGTVPELARLTERAYRHPYGFYVLRLRVPQVAPWKIRLHIWPDAIDAYEYVHANGSEGRLLHSHGWDLLSLVLSGALDESSYTLRHASVGAFVDYTATSQGAAQVSKLTPLSQRLDIQDIARTTRGPSDGVYLIRAGQVHNTMPAESSLSLVATNQLDGQTSHIFVNGTDDVEIAQPTPDLETDFDSLNRLYAHSELPQNWSSFVFLTAQEKVLLLRAVARPEQWHPVGGRREAEDSSPLSTLIREVREEIGIALDAALISWLEHSPADEGDGIACFWQMETDPVAFKFPHAEILEIKWMDLRQALELPMYRGAKSALTTLASRLAD